MATKKPKRRSKAATKHSLEHKAIAALEKFHEARRDGDRDKEDAVLDVAAPLVTDLFVAGAEAFNAFVSHVELHHTHLTRDLDSVMTSIFTVLERKGRATVFAYALAFKAKGLPSAPRFMTPPVGLEAAIAAGLGLKPSRVRVHPIVCDPYRPESPHLFAYSNVRGMTVTADGTPYFEEDGKIEQPFAGDRIEEDSHELVLLFSVMASKNADYWRVLDRLMIWSSESSKAEFPARVMYADEEGGGYVDTTIVPTDVASPHFLMHEASYREERAAVMDAIDRAVGGGGITHDDIIGIICPVAAISPEQQAAIDRDEAIHIGEPTGARITLWAPRLDEAVANLAFDKVANVYVLVRRLVSDLEELGMRWQIKEETMPAVICPDCGEPYFLTPEGPAHDHGGQVH